MIREAVERVLDGLPPGALERLRRNLADELGVTDMATKCGWPDRCGGR